MMGVVCNDHSPAAGDAEAEAAGLGVGRDTRRVTLMYGDGATTC